MLERIPLADMENVLKNILRNMECDPRQLDEMVMKGVIMAEQCDKDGTCSIDFDEFLVLISKTPQLSAYVRDRTSRSPQDGNMLEAFQAMGGNRDGSGFIDRNDLATSDMGFDPESIEEMMNDADTNKDGKISFKEFCAVMQ